MIPVLKSGFAILIKHTQLIFVVVLVVVFPLIFIFTFQQFITTAKSNTNTVVLQKIDALHDTLEFLVKNNLNNPETLQAFAIKQEDLKKVRIVKEEEDKLIIINDFDNTKIGTFEDNTQLYKSSFVNSGETIIFNPVIAGQSVSQAFRAIEISGQDTYYIFTEHDFSSLNSLLENRIEKSYLVFTFIFLFLIALAYWVARQINFEKKFARSLDQLKERDLFIDALVHEFRAPLTAIRGYASLLEETTNGDEKNFSIRIKEASARLVVLVNDFLEASRIQSGKLKVTLVEIDVKKTIDKVLVDMKSLADIKNLELKTQFPTTPIQFLTDEKRLEQILTNIINNAIKYTNKGEILVSLENDHVYTTITIADTGGGISAEDQKKLFSPFVRVGSSDQNDKVVGSGLGMWITKKLVEQLHGEISLESIKGVGTHVIIKLRNKVV
ncbi:MAG: HAMP domain-containing histidine kinase [Candidatus Pacebacteria bacterium]|nr:HAMP domain-containing histidine kinase [Candidatus Paceibacterota bacterium]